MSKGEMIPYSGMDHADDVELAEVIDDCPNCYELKQARDGLVEELKMVVEQIQFLRRAKLFTRQDVLENEGLNEWRIVEGEPYTWFHSKTIMLRADSSFALFLHAVAHALTPEPEVLPSGGKQFHDGRWADRFTELVNKYMKAKEHGCGQG